MEKIQINKNLKNKQAILIVGAVVVLVAGVAIVLGLKALLSKDDRSNVADLLIDVDNGDEKIDWSKYDVFNYELDGSLEISKEGIYNLTGEVKDGSVSVRTSGNVKLVLDNVTITNSTGPAIYVEGVEDVVIELIGENYLEDGGNYSVDDDAGVIYSKSDLTLQGEGALEVVANNADAIVGKDDLKIVSGSYTITAEDDGIRGKDSVYIKTGDFKIDAKGDGVKATNTTDETKGFIVIEGGSFEIDAELDGIQAERNLLIQDGDFSIVTGGGSINSSTSTVADNPWGRWGALDQQGQSQTDQPSAKGIKAGNRLVVEKGNFRLDTSDDAVHSNSYIGVKDGDFTIQSGDDGMHADEELVIDGGKIDIRKSYEGLEASKITINGGDIDVTALDDGINVAGGNDNSAMGRPGQNNFASRNDSILTINGGEIYVDATGDGLDANGSIYINGGTVWVDGPKDGANGALDYDQACVVNGGTLVAGGAREMMQGVSSSSKLYNVSIAFNQNYGSGDDVVIIDADGNEVIAYVSEKSYSSLVVASELFERGKTYTIMINGADFQSFTISEITTNIGGGGGFSEGGMPGRGDGGPMRGR